LPELIEKLRFFFTHTSTSAIYFKDAKNENDFGIKTGDHQNHNKQDTSNQKVKHHNPGKDRQAGSNRMPVITKKTRGQKAPLF